MALDNAQFISELSITDPPGTDPLSEGDDQIRTSKRTQQQSFPLIDAAVNKTSAQLNDVAQLSEVNTFALTQNFAAHLLGADGTAAAPQYAFTSVANMGMYRVSGNILGFAAGGVNRLTMDSTAFAPAQPIRHQDDGAATFPMYTFASENNTGMYLSAAGVLGFSASGLETVTISSAEIVARASFLQRDASLSNPSYAFENEIGTGFFRSASNTMTFTTSGVSRFVISNSGVTSSVIFNIQASATINALTDIANNFTFQRASSNRWQLRQANDTANPISANDFEIRRFNTSGVFQDVPFKIENNRGLISMEELPLTASGLSTGMLWQNAGFVRIA